MACLDPNVRKQLNMPLQTLVPAILARDWWDAWDYPERIMDQCFGSLLFEGDLQMPRYFQGYTVRPRTKANIATSGVSEVKNSENGFKVDLDISQFKPEEVHVKVVDNFIEIHGKHEEKEDVQGIVTREFTRRYMLPRSCPPESVTSSLSPDGILTLLAPKITMEEFPKMEHPVPINCGG